jgi:hypothetical protein
VILYIKACSTSDIRTQSIGVVLGVKCNVAFAQNGYLLFLIEYEVNAKANPTFSNSKISIEHLVQECLGGLPKHGIHGKRYFLQSERI